MVHDLVEPVGHDLGSDVRVEDPDCLDKIGSGHRPSAGFEDLAGEDAAVMGEIGRDGSDLLTAKLIDWRNRWSPTPSPIR